MRGERLTREDGIRLFQCHDLAWLGALADHVRRADVIVAAAGCAGIVTRDMVAPGAIVLDVGVSRVQGEDGKARLMGDVADGVDEVASWLSPNPGGVGPMTRALLVTNVVEAAERQAGISAN